MSPDDRGSEGVSPEGISAELLAEARPAIEAIVMVADQPIEPNLLAQVLEMPTDQVEALCTALAGEYESGGRGFQLVRVAGGYRFQSHPDQAPYVERFVLEGQSARLSAAALETMAIVAYKQPISRAQVAAIRGVNVDAVVRTLEHRGYIAEVGRDPGPGQAVLFGTTALFLERLGLFSLDDLPPLGDFVPGADIVEALERGLRPVSADEAVAVSSDEAEEPSERSDEPFAEEPFAEEQLVEELAELADEELAEPDEG